jgi:hypothetical protein
LSFLTTAFILTTTKHFSYILSPLASRFERSTKIAVVGFLTIGSQLTIYRQYLKTTAKPFLKIKCKILLNMVATLRRALRAYPYEKAQILDDKKHTAPFPL